MTGRTRWWATALLRLAPAAWRERYRAEILAHLSSSEHRIRDAANIALTALGLRTEQIRRSQHLVKIAVVILVVGSIWTVWAVPQLADGLMGLPGHWWSAPGPVLVLAGGLIATRSAGRRHRTG